jgi:hypothetical protein
MVGPVAQRDAHNDGQADADPARLIVLVDEVDLDILDGRRPSVEAEYFVGERDAFLGGDVVDFLTGGACARRDVLGAELLLEAALESGNFLGGVIGYPLLGLNEGVRDAGVLVPGAVCIVNFRCGMWTGTSMGDAISNRVTTYAGILAMFYE